MAVQLKRTEGAVYKQECGFGCCTPVHGKNTKLVRRHTKRIERQAFKRDLARGEY